MPDRPLVSIITPAYNAAAFISETIESVQAQTFHDWEMLVSNDASTDRTGEIVQAFAKLDPRIRVLSHTSQRGAAEARNAALEKAQGRYICFLDSDDLWLPEKLARQLAFIRERGAAFSYTAYRRMSQDGTNTGRLIDVPERLTYEDLLRNTAIATLTTMLDQEKTGPLRLQDVGYEDYALWLSLLRQGHVAQGLREDLARYRVVAGSLSSNPLRALRRVWHIYRHLEGLSVAKSLWCLLQYLLRASLKRV